MEGSEISDVKGLLEFSEKLNRCVELCTVYGAQRS